MRRIVTIGGVTPPLNLDKIDREIINMTGKKNPKVLYVPTAGGDDLNYRNFFKGIYEGRLGCKYDELLLVTEEPSISEVREKILSSDIVYIDGGNQERLIRNLRKYKVDEVIKEAFDRNIVFAGKSAGSICWGKHYFVSDDPADFADEGFKNYTVVDCLGHFNYMICPHYNNEDYKRKHHFMMKHYDLVGIGIDNDCAIEFWDDKYRVISTRDDANAYKITKKKDKYMIEQLGKSTYFRSLDEL